MNEDHTQAPAREKRPFSIASIFVWAAVLLVAYVLSIGPVVMMLDNGTIQRGGKIFNFVCRVYIPIIWAYDRTPLHRPLGMYLHLWSKRFDAKGD